jgi:hypothetical protein
MKRNSKKPTVARFVVLTGTQLVVVTGGLISEVGLPALDASSKDAAK